MRMVTVGAENTMAHPRITGEISNGNSLQAESPRGEKMKSAVPGKIIYPRGCLEKDDRLSVRRRFLTRNGAALEKLSARWKKPLLPVKV